MKAASKSASRKKAATARRAERFQRRAEAPAVQRVLREKQKCRRVERLAVFRRRIAELLERPGIRTRAVLAAKAGVSRQTVDQWLGPQPFEPRLNKVLNLAEAVGHPVAWFFSNEDAGPDLASMLAKAIWRRCPTWEEPELLEKQAHILEATLEGWASTLGRPRAMRLAFLKEAIEKVGADRFPAAFARLAPNWVGFDSDGGSVTSPSG